MKHAMSLLVALALAGCVSQGRYDAAVSETTTTRAELSRTKTELDRQVAAVTDLRRQIGELQALEANQSGDATANRARVETLQKRLAEIEAAQRATEARAALYRDLTRRLQKQIDAGDLAVVVRDGRMVLQLPDDVLFDSGRTELKPAGKAALHAVADVVKSLPQRHFQVSGHTDDVPIHNDRFASNWELSTARAVRVVHFLVTDGADPRALSAAGYSEQDPVAPNTTPEGRKQNRRTEITLQPNIDELVKVP